jgi:VWFA-related protein
MGEPRHPKRKNGRYFVSMQTAAGNQKRLSGAKWPAAALVFIFMFVLGWLAAGVPAAAAQSSASQTPAGQAQPAQVQPPQAQPPQTQPAQTQNQVQNNDIPDAPTVQPPAAETPEPPPMPKPEAKKPVERDPWTNQPINKPAATEPAAAPADDASSPPPMPPVKTVPPGSSAKPGPSAQDQLYTLVVHTNFVQVPVTVKDHSGRRVDGLLSTDFTIKENGVEQKLSFFTADPFGLSVAIVLDLGMPDAEVQKVNQTFPALVGAFAPYDEVALYTYSSTVSQVSDFAGATKKLTALLNQMKTETGRNNGVPVLNGPLAPNGPIINGMPVGSGTEPVYTPPKESHVLNDAILQAALALRKRDRTRRKIIFVISDGREYGSKASYNDVKRVLLSNEIQVQAVTVGSAALPVYDKIQRLRVPLQGYGNILPKYASATGGAVYAELTQSAIDNMYAQVMSEARSQYTLGYTPVRPKTQTTASIYRSIEVVVHRPGLKIYARDGYYAMPAAAAK